MILDDLDKLRMTDTFLGRLLTILQKRHNRNRHRLIVTANTTGSLLKQQWKTSPNLRSTAESIFDRLGVMESIRLQGGTNRR